MIRTADVVRLLVTALAVSAASRKRSRTPSLAPSDAAKKTLNGPQSTPGKRKAAADEGDATTPNGKGGLAVDGTPRGAKRSRRATTPGAAKREAPAYIVKKGMNALPEPIPAITKALLHADLASRVTAASSKLPHSAESLLKQPPVLPREMFVFGNGDMGQHGLGTEVLDEIKRPRRHVGIAKSVEEGKLGPGGLEVIAAGGMHTLAIDSNGQVRHIAAIIAAQYGSGS